MPIETQYHEREVIVKVAEGDEAAFYQLFAHYMPLLRPFVLRFTHSEFDTEEVLQDSMLRVWLYRDRLEDIQDIRAWIFKVTARECLTRLRRQATDRRHKESFALQEEPLAFTPLDLLQGVELDLAIRDAIRKMPEKRREIYSMSRDLGLKPSEIARKLSLSVGTVKNVLSHALRELRERLGEK